MPGKIEKKEFIQALAKRMNSKVSYKDEKNKHSLY
jgi:hypothetical protein